MNSLHQLHRQVDAILFAGLGTMKKALKEIKAMPGGVLHKGRIQRHGGTSSLGFPTGSAYAHPKVGHHPLHVQHGIMPDRKGISIAKGKNADMGLIARRDVVLHEAGHQADPKMAKLQKRANKYTNAVIAGRVPEDRMYRSKTQRLVKGIMDSERTANHNAISTLKRAGGSPQEVQDYRRSARKAFKTYKIQHIGGTIGADDAARGRLSPLVDSANESGDWKAVGREMRATTKEKLKQYPHLRGYGFSGHPKGALRLAASW